MSRRRQTDETTTETLDLARLIERRIDIMEKILMVREPSSLVAAEAYDGLRKQIVVAAQERQAHVAQLVQFAAALDDGADPGTLAAMVTGWLESAGVMTRRDVDSADADILFHVVDDQGGPVWVLAPAYVDSASGRVIRQGRLRRGPATSQATSVTGDGSEGDAS